jgi:DNA polymerase I-like protein with 3'-5' exonuclease and polymerase domains
MIILDFETQGLSVWSPEVGVTSAAFAWREGDEIKSRFSSSPPQVEADLARLAETQQEVGVFNVGFEGLVMLCKYPHLKLNITTDVMRLVQLYDNGEDVQSYGLKPAAERILGPEHAGWEKEIRAYLLGNGHKAHEYHKAPYPILRRYNVGDVVATLRLYEHITESFSRIGFDWRFDHRLYMSSAAHIVRAQAEGVRVDREGLAKYVQAIRTELSDNEQEFRSKYAEAITEVEKRVTSKEQAKFKKKVVERIPFNVDSNAQREMLFCGVMGIKPKFLTATGNPSFKAEHLGTYGEAGSHLADRKSRQIVLTQAESLLALSEEDNQWHVSLKLSGTNTGRYAGGSQ